MKRVIVAAIVLSIPLSLPVLAASSGADIKAALVGNTFDGGMGGSKYTSFFGTDGTYKDATGAGKYSIEGDSVCYPGTDFGCYQATITGNKLEWSKDGKSEGTGTIVKGNPMKF